jgi:hypothetical protein
MDESESQGDFKVSDRRRFTSQGEPASEEKTTEGSARQSEPIEEPEPEKGPETLHQEAGQESAQAKEPLPMDFISFVMSLANTAVVQMGLAQTPEAGESVKDLAGAKQLIDIIGMLEEKTRGNLDEEEKKILNDTLFQLRMAFVEASK